ncbi:MAG: hypothetical protein HY321_19770 [Armatimonadetes bacterium]|nr:hypothetical protein [Armatimonadota bacterium]
MSVQEVGVTELREMPQERALITVGILHRLFGDGERSDSALVEGMAKASLLVRADLRVRRQYEVLVRIFREAQAKDVEWCARCLAQLALADRPGDGVPEGVSMLHEQALRVRAGEGEMDDRQWPAWIQSMREGVDRHAH